MTNQAARDGQLQAGRLLKVLGVAFCLAVLVGNTIRMGIFSSVAGDPFVAATAAARLFGPTGDIVVRIVMVLSLVAAVNALQLIATRVPFATSRDRLLPSLLQHVNPG